MEVRRRGSKVDGGGRLGERGSRGKTKRKTNVIIVGWAGSVNADKDAKRWKERKWEEGMKEEANEME